MERISDNKIVLVIRRTRLDDLVARFNTVEQARFYVEHLGADFSDYVREHEQYRAARSEAERILEAMGRLQVLDRRYLPNFLFGAEDTVVVLGQDGLVANTVKYATEQPIIGVNPDRARWDGVLLPFGVSDLQKVVPEVFAGRRGVKEVTMARAELSNGQQLLAVNDLFIGVRSHTSARYRITLADAQEQHSSSGVIVSTGLGSTGWFKSLMTGALGIVSALTGAGLPREVNPVPWDAAFLVFTVREPFPSKVSETNLVSGVVTEQTPLVIVSQMAESGVIFSDGIESDFLEFNSGMQATIRPAEQRGHLVV